MQVRGARQARQQLAWQLAWLQQRQPQRPALARRGAAV
jgi:hypothetical protein